MEKETKYGMDKESKVSNDNNRIIVVHKVPVYNDTLLDTAIKVVAVVGLITVFTFEIRDRLQKRKYRIKNQQGK